MISATFLKNDLQQNIPKGSVAVIRFKLAQGINLKPTEWALIGNAIVGRTESGGPSHPTTSHRLRSVAHTRYVFMNFEASQSKSNDDTSSILQVALAELISPTMLLQMPAYIVDFSERIPSALGKQPADLLRASRLRQPPNLFFVGGDGLLAQSPSRDLLTPG